MKKRVLGEDELGISNGSKVKVTRMNHIIDVQYLAFENSGQQIQKLDAERYVVLSTGELKYFDKKENRGQNLNSLRKTFRRLRELINTNFVGSKNELFITLTYKNQTNDSKQIYKDFKNFIDRLKYKYKGQSTIDYINVLEPHASGNFHMHVLMRFNDVRSIFILNKDLAEVWGHGFVKIQSLEGVDNIGAYVSAYLTDIEIDQSAETNDLVEEKLQSDGTTKKILKGGRMHFYPPGINIYRKSKGISEPIVEKMAYKDIKKETEAGTLVSRYGIEITEDDFNNIIIKEQYNLKRR